MEAKFSTKTSVKFHCTTQCYIPAIIQPLLNILALLRSRATSPLPETPPLCPTCRYNSSVPKHQIVSITQVMTLPVLSPTFFLLYKSIPLFRNSNALLRLLTQKNSLLIKPLFRVLKNQSYSLYRSNNYVFENTNVILFI
jgi:hypothetical protein